jgi:hypothetical protein
VAHKQHDEQMMNDQLKREQPRQ